MLTRRALLRGGAAAVGSATVLDLQKRMMAHGVSELTGASSAQIPEGSVPANKSEVFTDFFSWWGKYGRASAERQSETVRNLDPDLLIMRSLSLVEKVRIQKRRNVERIMRTSREDFLRRLARDGSFHWWP